MRIIQRNIGKIIKMLFLTTMVIVSLLPIYWTIVNSFRTNTQILNKFSLFPEQFEFTNFIKIFSVSTLPTSFLNSVIVTGGTMALTALIATMAAFALSSYRFKWGPIIYVIFIAGIFIPSATTMGMIYKLLQSINLLGTRTGIIMLYTAGRLSLSIFLLVAFMQAIPTAIKEAALIDGCKTWRMYAQIVLPLSKNGLLVVMILTFITVWNDYLWSMILLPSASKRTLTVALAFFKGEYFTDYGLLSASVVVGLLPIIVAYLFMQDKIISGIASAAVKG